MAKNKVSYKNSLESLEKIFEDLREGRIEIDDLDTTLKKALEHIKICKEILDGQEAKVKDILKEMDTRP